MSSRIRKEEYTTLGDFILPSFERDHSQIMAKYPKLDNAFLTNFKDKLAFVKRLESKIVLGEKQKTVTRTLYETSEEFRKDLTFLLSYIKDLGLDISAVRDLRKDLHNRNIEGAILKTEAMKQYVTEHQAILEAEGMEEGMIEKLTNYKEEMESKNAEQNVFMNQMKELTDRNVRHYEELYTYISNITEKGKLVFSNTITQDEYTLTKNISRMRAPVSKAVNESDTENAEKKAS